jgi:hypothetical protein
VLAAKTLYAFRVAALPAAIDALQATHPGVVLRLAPDEAITLHPDVPQVDDPHGIVESETGFSVVGLTWEEFDEHVRHHIEWTLPAHRPALAQGLVAFVPTKLWITNSAVLLIFATAYADELLERLT